MRLLARALIVVVVALGLVAPPANAEPHNFGGLLGELWTTVLELPTPENPYGDGDDPCIELRGNVVAPLSGEGVAACTVRRGTKILFSGWTWECSTFEGNGTTEAELRTCAQKEVAKARPSVTFNGKTVRLSSVESGLLHITLPADNIFGYSYPDLTGLSVAAGYEYLTKPLTSGTLRIVNTLTIGDDPPKIIETVITVE